MENAFAFLAGMTFKWKIILRVLVFPLLLGAVYFAQLQYPGLSKQCALWSDHPRWWQFFTNVFLSGPPVHLLINVCGLWFVSSQFAPRIRISFLFIYFLLFSAASSFLYFKWAMPSHATLVGASSGIYSLFGFLSWFLRRDRVGFFGILSLSAPVLPFMVFMLILEFFLARYWIPVLAWQLHLIAFGLSVSTALSVHAVYALVHWLAERGPVSFKRIFRPCALILTQIRETVRIPAVNSNNEKRDRYAYSAKTGRLGGL
jgi:membrane associated rhomboid family serine protease